MTKEERNKYARDTYALLKRLHLCIQCKAQDAYTLAGRARCYECTEKNNINARNSRKNKNKSETDNYRNDLRQRYRDEHKCIFCGKKLLTADKHTTCYRCRRKANNRKRISREINGTISRDILRDNGICWNCCKNPVLEGKKVCEKCYEKNLATLNSIKRHNDLHIWRSQETARRAEVKANGK